ncbi:T9SS type A sorting domain-containing protein [Flavobacterium chuncheonense]|uniref:T9SS type A sorting domain-containing protein n=1 Tax=Flavobacterium chuncheonense TaxID=2026653 RepID=A0ABW5YNL6_9FLAO
MSKFLYIVLFFSNFCISQIYYSHYINETSVWRYEAHRYLTGGMPGGINSTSYVTEYIDGTSNINGYTYYKKYSIWIRFGVQYPIYGPTYIREGSDGKFYKLDSTNTIETEYFDNNPFQNIQNGTTINDLSTNPIPSCTANVSFIAVGGLNLKKVENVGYKIEGIGGVYGGGICSGITYSCFHCPYDTHPNNYDLLYSYTKDGSTYYENSTGGSLSNYPVPSYLSTKSFDTFETKIFPNPTTDIVNIQSDFKIDVIEVFDIQGREIEIILLNDFQAKLNFNNYQKGTYIIKVKTELGTQIKKIILK